MKKISKSRRGIAIVVALVFMSAMLIISTTTATLATSIAKNAGDSYKSLQAYYYAESAVEEGLHAYKNGGDYKTEDNPESNYDIKGLTDAAPVNGWMVYPYPGTGTAGKNCEVSKPLNEEDVRAQISQGFTVSQEMDDFLKENNAAEDYPCNWNKIKSTDSAIEIPLYAIQPDGTKVQLEFDEFQVRVRTACDETKLGKEKGVYDQTGMCGAENRYGMKADPNVLQVVLNWGIYSSDSGNYMVPLKDSSADALAWNITGNNINLRKSDGFVVLNDTKSGMLNGIKKQISLALKSQNISSPFIRFTVELPFVSDDSPIPNLEYQILYQASNGSFSQFKGIPVIVGEGISGGFKHQIKMSIHETKTGFDYAYQKQ